MFRLRAVLAALLLGAPFTASAAEITRLASSFDEDDPFVVCHRSLRSPLEKY